MFQNLNWWEIGALLLLALLIFGDKLPKVITDGLRMLRSLRNMATNATADLSRELGTDIKLEDLHPKAFIRKHLLSEEEEQAIRKPLQGLYDNVKSDLGGVRDDITGVRDDVSAAARGRASANGSATGSSAGGADSGSGNAAGNGSAPASNAAPGRPSYTFDADAT